MKAFGENVFIPEFERGICIQSDPSHKSRKSDADCTVRQDRSQSSCQTSRRRSGRTVESLWSCRNGGARGEGHAKEGDGVEKSGTRPRCFTLQ